MCSGHLRALAPTLNLPLASCHALRAGAKFSRLFRVVIDASKLWNGAVMDEQAHVLSNWGRPWRGRNVVTCEPRRLMLQCPRNESPSSYASRTSFATKHKQPSWSFDRDSRWNKMENQHPAGVCSVNKHGSGRTAWPNSKQDM